MRQRSSGVPRRPDDAARRAARGARVAGAEGDRP